MPCAGVREPFLDLTEMEAAVAELPGVTEAEAGRAARRPDHLMNAARTALVFDLAEDLYHYDLESHRARRLTASPGREEEVSFSPDGLLVAFVRDHNLFVVAVDHRREYALTTDGDTATRNGQLDWVYQEEIYGRGNFRGYWWSPDSARIAYLQLDDARVPHFTIVDHLAYHQNVEVWHYPKAGDPNPRVRLGVVRTRPGERRPGSTSSSTSRARPSSSTSAGRQMAWTWSFKSRIESRLGSTSPSRTPNQERRSASCARRPRLG